MISQALINNDRPSLSPAAAACRTWPARVGPKPKQVSRRRRANSSISQMHYLRPPKKPQLARLARARALSLQDFSITRLPSLEEVRARWAPARLGRRPCPESMKINTNFRQPPPPPTTTSPKVGRPKGLGALESCQLFWSPQMAAGSATTSGAPLRWAQAERQSRS